MTGEWWSRISGVLTEPLSVKEGDVIELGSVCVLLIGSGTDLSTMELKNHRNPDRIEQLIEIASDETKDLPRAGEELERSAARAPGLLAEMASDHLVDELVTLLIRNQSPVRNALTRALDRMISEQILEKSVDGAELRSRTRRIVEQELDVEQFGGEAGGN